MERANQLRGAPLRQGALEVPAGLATHPSLKAAAKWAAVVLWNEAGRRPNTIATTYGSLAAAVGREDRRAREWVETLAEAGLIEIVSASSRSLVVYVNDPDEVVSELRDRSAQADPQSLLFETEQAPPAEDPAASATVVSRPGGAAGRPTVEYPTRGIEPGQASAVLVPKPPAETAPKPPSRDSSGETTYRLKDQRIAELAAIATGLPPPSNSAETVPKPPGADLDLNLNLNLNGDFNLKRVVRAEAGRAHQSPRPISALVGDLNLDLDERAESARRREQSLAAHLRQLCRRAIERSYQRRGVELPAEPPEVRESPCFKVARAIIDGEGAGDLCLDRFVDALNSAIASPNLKDPAETPFYIIGAWQTQFDDHGVAWGNRKPKRKPKPKGSKP